MRPKFWTKPKLFFWVWIFRNRYRRFFSDTKSSETETETSLQGSITKNYPFVFASVVVFFILIHSFFETRHSRNGISLETEMSHSAFDKQNLIIYQPRNIRNKIRRQGCYIAYTLFVNLIFKTSFFAMLELGILFLI